MLDIVFLFFLLYYIYKGYKTGFLLAIIKALAIMIGLIIATHFSVALSKALFGEYAQGMGQKVFPFLSFGILFFVVKFLVTLLGTWIQKAVSISLIGTINRLGGAAVYGLMFIFITSIILYFLQGLSLIDSSNTSIVVQRLLPLSADIYNMAASLIPFVKDTYSQLDTYLGQKTASMP